VARPLTVTVACGLILVSGVLLLLWGLATLSRRRSFNAAVKAVFDLDSNADTSVGWLEILFLFSAVFSMALGCVYLSLLILVYHGSTWARILVWLVSAAALWFTWHAHVRNGASYLHAQGTGPDLDVTIAEMRQVNDLTPWRFSGWYHHITIGFGVALTAFIPSVAILLILPS
jgi:hypothetical protein